MILSKNKQTNSVFLYYDRIVLFIFWKNSRIAKSLFEINWPLQVPLLICYSEEKNQYDQNHFLKIDFKNNFFVMFDPTCPSHRELNQKWFYGIHFFKKNSTLGWLCTIVFQYWGHAIQQAAEPKANCNWPFATRILIFSFFAPTYCLNIIPFKAKSHFVSL